MIEINLKKPLGILVRRCRDDWCSRELYRRNGLCVFCGRINFIKFEGWLVSSRIRYSRDVDSTCDTNATTPANSPQPLHFSQELRASPDLLLDLDRLAFFFRLDFNLTPPAICPQNLC